MRPLSDFGFGGRSIWEGGVGLFLVSSAVLFALSLAWLKGFQMRSKFRKYTATFEFDQACGICTGTPVRIRGVTVGDVIRVNPSLRSIESGFAAYFELMIILIVYGGWLIHVPHYPAGKVHSEHALGLEQFGSSQPHLYGLQLSSFCLYGNT